MILYLPKNFDQNEWFIIVSMVFMIILLILIPKRLHFIEVLSLWLLNIFLAHAVDYSVIGPPINLYYSNDTFKYEIFDFLLYYFLYPSTMYLFYIGLARRFIRKHWFIYVCFASIMTTGLEKMAHLMNVFTYINWSLWYSLIVYIVIYTLNVAFYILISNQVK
jgi:hypothetical protein